MPSIIHSSYGPNHACIQCDLRLEKGLVRGRARVDRVGSREEVWQEPEGGLKIAQPIRVAATYPEKGSL